MHSFLYKPSFFLKRKEFLFNQNKSSRQGGKKMENYESLSLEGLKIEQKKIGEKIKEIEKEEFYKSICGMFYKLIYRAEEAKKRKKAEKIQEEYYKQHFGHA